MVCSRLKRWGSCTGSGGALDKCVVGCTFEPGALLGTWPPLRLLAWQGLLLFQLHSELSVLLCMAMNAGQHVIHAQPPFFHQRKLWGQL